jgi:ribose/xylose/arabinose/galactoside ABC-type transport system permease subunit
MNGREANTLWLRRYGLAGVIVLACAVLALLEPTFLTWRNWIILTR